MKQLFFVVKKNLSTLAFIVLTVLMLTGNLGFVTTTTQLALLKTGIMDADVSSKEDTKLFDYNFTIKDLAGKSLDLDQFRGKVVFLNLWATWCGPCRAEMPTIQELYNEMDHDKIVFIMLSLDRLGDESKVSSYMKKKGFTFPAYTQATTLPDLLKVPSIPTTFVIAKDGKVVSENIGTTNFNTKKFKKFLIEESNK